MQKIALKTMVGATAEELHILMSDAERLQDSFAPQGDLSPETMSSLQRLDYLTQSLDALSNIWMKLMEDIPEDLSVENMAVIDDIGLKDLAAKLKGIAAPMISTSLASSGELEEF